MTLKVGAIGQAADQAIQVSVEIIPARFATTGGIVEFGVDADTLVERCAVVIIFSNSVRIIMILLRASGACLIQTADQLGIGTGYGNKTGKQQQEHQHTDDGPHKAVAGSLRGVG